MTILFQPWPGPQTQFAQWDGYYGLYAGAAGPGKTELLRWDPWDQIEGETARVARGEIQFSVGRSILFRRTMPELRELIDRCHRDFSAIDPGAVWNQNDKTWTMSCGYKYMFGQMEEPGDWIKYYGFEFCTAEGTRVLMADGSLTPIETIRIGDQVQTLEGPRTVTATYSTGVKPCVSCEVRTSSGDYLGTQVHPTTHPVLHETSGEGTDSMSSQMFRVTGRDRRSGYVWQDYESLLAGLPESPVKRVSSITKGSDSGESCGQPRAPWPLRELSVPLVLHARSVRRGLASRQISTESQQRAAELASQALHHNVLKTSYAAAGGQQGSGVSKDLTERYLSLSRQHYAQLPALSGSVQGSAQQSAGAERRDHTCLPMGGLAQILPSTPYTKSSYPHFYSGASRARSEDVRMGRGTLRFAGWYRTYDLTVEGANHYITDTGLINAQTWIGFDELTTFTEEQFDQLDTRLRCKDPVLHRQRRIRAGTNPVGIGLEWVRRRFVEVAPPGTPVVVRVPVLLTLPDGSKKQVIEERSQLYIPAKLSDNPSIDQASYTATLMTKSSSTRRQLLEGDWYVSAGSCFGDLWDQEVHVCKPFKIPQGWTKFRSGDYGVSWPGLSSIQWWAVDTDGNFICYRSLTIGNLNAAELAEKIREVEIDNDEWDLRSDCSKLTGPLDSSCWSKTGHVGLSIAKTMISMGVLWSEAPRSETQRNQAADQIRQRLTRRTKHPTMKDENGKPLYIVPGIRWFDTCWNYVRRSGGTKVRVGPIITIPVVPADETKPDVWDTKANDHDLDSCAYACMYRPLVPTHDEVTHDEMDDLARARAKAKAQRTTGKSGYWNFL